MGFRSDYAPAPVYKQGLRTVLFGTSLAGMNGDITDLWWPDRGWFNVLNIRAGKRFRLVKNAGVGGDSAADMLDRLFSDVLPYDPDIVFMDGGSIDVAAGDSETDIQTRLLTMFRTFTARNITVISLGVPPITGMTAGQIDSCYALTNWIRNLAMTEPGLIFADWFGTLMDVTTGTEIAAYCWDTPAVHPNPTGAIRIADAIYRQLTNGGFFHSVGLLPQTDGDNKNLCTNGMMTGNVGGVATGWTLSGGVTTPTKVARSDYVQGEWQRITITSGNPSLVQDVTLASVGLAVGDTVKAMAEFAYQQATPANVVSHQFGMLMFNGGALVSTHYDLYRNPPGQSGGPDGNAAALIPSGVYETPEIVIPATTTKIRMAWNPFLGAGGVADISRIGLYKVV